MFTVSIGSRREIEAIRREAGDEALQEISDAQLREAMSRQFVERGRVQLVRAADLVVGDQLLLSSSPGLFYRDKIVSAVDFERRCAGDVWIEAGKPGSGRFGSAQRCDDVFLVER